MNNKQNKNSGVEPIKVSLPDGSKVDINTKEGANAYLQEVSQFSHVSFNLKQIRKLKSKKRLNKRQQTQLCGLYESIICIAKNADPDVFATKIPQFEIQDWLNFIIEEIKNSTKKTEWINSGVISDSTVLYLCIDMFKHAVPVSMAFESEFFHVYASFLKAWVGFDNPICSLTLSCSGRILVHTMAISESVHGWSLEKIFNKFEASGLLEQIIRLSVIFKPVGIPCLDEAGLTNVLDDLQSCPDILARKFKGGEACGDILNSALDCVRDGSRTIDPTILGRLKGLANLAQAVDSTDFEALLVSGACSFCAKISDTKLQVCDRCRFVFYCSKECQKADWKVHKCNCHKLNTAALDRLFSLRMSIVLFMNQYFQTICEEMSETGLEASDLAIEISFMPDDNGIIHAWNDTPVFKVVPIGDYVSGKFPAWFSALSSAELKWFKDMAEMVETVCKPVFGALVVYHAGRTHIDVGTLEQYHEAADNSMEDIRLQLGTKYWCSRRMPLCVVESEEPAQLS